MDQIKYINNGLEEFIEIWPNIQESVERKDYILKKPTNTTVSNKPKTTVANFDEKVKKVIKKDIPKQTISETDIKKQVVIQTPAPVQNVDVVEKNLQTSTVNSVETLKQPAIESNVQVEKKVVEIPQQSNVEASNQKIEIQQIPIKPVTQQDAQIENGYWVDSKTKLTDEVDKVYAPGTIVSVVAVNPHASCFSFSHWEADADTVVQFIPSNELESVKFSMPVGSVKVTAVYLPVYHVGDTVRINDEAENFATGEQIPEKIHGMVDTVDDVRVRNSYVELHLSRLNMWIAADDIERISCAPEVAQTKPIEVAKKKNIASIVGGSWALTKADEAAGVSTTADRDIEPGTIVGAYANFAPTGSVFSHWEINRQDVYFFPNEMSGGVLFEMPNGSVKLTAIYEKNKPQPCEKIEEKIEGPQKYMVAVQNGRFASLDGFEDNISPRMITSGVPIKVVANMAPKGFVFSHWESDIKSVEFNPDKKQERVQFIMPNSAVNIYCKFKPAPEVVVVPKTIEPLISVKPIIKTENQVEIPIQTVVKPATKMVNVTVIDGTGGGTYPVGHMVEILAQTYPCKTFKSWSVENGKVSFENQLSAHTTFVLGEEDVLVKATYSPVCHVYTQASYQNNPVSSGFDIPTTKPLCSKSTFSYSTEVPKISPQVSSCSSQVYPKFQSVESSSFNAINYNVGDHVLVNNGVTTWATGEKMPSWVSGRIYPVMEIRVRNNATELLLGNGANAWILASNVSMYNEKQESSIALNTRVVVNMNASTWATGESIPQWVLGKSYTVIESRIRNGERQLLLGDGLKTWIRDSDVTLLKATQGKSNNFAVGDRVKLKDSAKTWVSGHQIPAWLFGRSYPIQDIRTRNKNVEVMLGEGLNSWIHEFNCTKV